MLEILSILIIGIGTTMFIIGSLALVGFFTGSPIIIYPAGEVLLQLISFMGNGATLVMFAIFIREYSKKNSYEQISNEV